MTNIFVCSTYLDLKEYRDRVERVVLKFGHMVRGMEFFGVSAHPTLEVCYDNIRKCDLIICIVGVSYGTRPTSGQPSYTEHEVTHARNLGLPIAPFFLDIDHGPIKIDFKHIARGEDEKALLALKKSLSSPNTIPGYFTSPEELGELIATYLGKEGYREEARTTYRECNYDLIAEWYDHWYKGHWMAKEPFKTIESIGRHEYRNVFHNEKGKIRVLDCACGSGNSYIAFHEAGYEVFGTDGSKEMLIKARENCKKIDVDHRHLIEHPINWKDLNAYKKFLAGCINNGGFDVIVNTSNSFCHIPPTTDYMSLALENYKALLKPGGLLFIDTKRFVQDTPLKGDDGRYTNNPIYKELRFVDGEWKLRTERDDKQYIPELGGWIHFHTCLHYDIDRSFGAALNRALIVLTVYGGTIFPRTFVIPYYPLPVNILEAFMHKAGFSTKIFHATDDPETEYRYDLIVGQKET